ncbi:NTP pyrophosphatase (non-canonical NTP hydrolase) [Actinoalloteichus hoggarensis]|uniref:MazG nucleotide pyrophosphohydrolase domain protein n=1 Tax=Actinoalloteichus hoggarensis TaxID=1470176 RepID=A0A221VZX7_9PSEU|nr:nucleotide pyrophosphohydrolase [Actinoalloteichus hoggarensis]ASO19075.1 MazG nucleotide pyrophosphohydrolase domain protein [Actinoalloteichus hoggarensis]MBB5920313.1 NTP pyrophosphatase (non-canonical NTP hydrolase) [Actinoalloteichus hoggarensis]
MDEFSALRARQAAFVEARGWQEFHTPKNLALALTGEVGELVSEIQWLDPADIPTALAEGPLRDRLADEAADVLLYLLRFADSCGIDLLDAANAKIDRNERRFPAELQRGTIVRVEPASTTAVCGEPTD